jgi:hypothetical protein
MDKLEPETAIPTTDQHNLQRPFSAHIALQSLQINISPPSVSMMRFEHQGWVEFERY